MSAYCYVWRKANGWVTDTKLETAAAEVAARKAARLGLDDAIALAQAGFALAFVAANLTMAQRYRSGPEPQPQSRGGLALQRIRPAFISRPISIAPSLPSRRQCEPPHKASRLRTRQGAPRERAGTESVNADAPTKGLIPKHLALASPIDSHLDTEHGNVGSARSDGRRSAAAVGPAHGPKRHPARLWPRPATPARQGTRQPLQRVWSRPGPHCAASEQHGDRTSHQLLCRRGPAQPRHRTRHHVGGQCRHDADRPGAVVQYRSRRAGVVRGRPRRLPLRSTLPNQGYRPYRDRPWLDAAVAAHPARHAGACGERAGRTRRDVVDHRRSRALHRHRRTHHLGGAFERRQRAADHVAGLFAVHHARCGAGAGARGQSRQRHQPRVRRRKTRRSRELSPAGRQSRQPRRRHCAGPAVPGHDRFPHACLAARSRQDDCGVPHRLQRRHRRHLHRPARHHVAAVDEAPAGSCAGNRPGPAALSRRDRAGEPLARARGRRPRDVAHGRSRRNHAAQGDGRDDDRRPLAGRPGLEDGQHRRQSR